MTDLFTPLQKEDPDPEKIYELIIKIFNDRAAVADGPVPKWIDNYQIMDLAKLTFKEAYEICCFLEKKELLISRKRINSKKWALAKVPSGYTRYDDDHFLKQ